MLLTEEIEGQFRDHSFVEDVESSQFNYYEIDHAHQRIIKKPGALIVDNGYSRKSSISHATSANPFKLAKPLSPSRYGDDFPALAESSDDDDDLDRHDHLQHDI